MYRFIDLSIYRFINLLDIADIMRQPTRDTEHFTQSDVQVQYLWATSSRLIESVNLASQVRRPECMNSPAYVLRVRRKLKA